MLLLITSINVCVFTLLIILRHGACTHINICITKDKKVIDACHNIANNYNPY